MMEMDTEIIKQYFKFIENFIEDDGYFFTINRYRKKRRISNSFFMNILMIVIGKLFLQRDLGDKTGYIN